MAAGATCLLVGVTWGYARSTARIARSAAETARAARETVELALRQGALGVQPRVSVPAERVATEYGSSALWSPTQPLVEIPAAVQVDAQNLGPGLAWECSWRLWCEEVRFTAEGTAPQTLQPGESATLRFALPRSSGADLADRARAAKTSGRGVEGHLQLECRDLWGNEIEYDWHLEFGDRAIAVGAARIGYANPIGQPSLP